MSMQNSYAEFVLGTLAAMLKDFAEEYPGLAKEFERDEVRLRSAVEQHGIEFVLVTMPEFRKHFDKCLSESRLRPSHLCNFGCLDVKEVPIPRLFRGLVLRVFNGDGSLKNQPDPHAIRALRTILGLFKKLRVPCGVDNERKAVADFIQVESEMSPPSSFWEGEGDFPSYGGVSERSFTDFCDTPRLKNLASWRCDSLNCDWNTAHEILYTVQRTADLVCGYLGVFDADEWRFKHGPGAVADGPFSANKYRLLNWSHRLEEAFPQARFGFPNYSWWVDSIREKLSGSTDEQPVKLCCVPKTRTAPRLIAVEPTAHQWCQQSLRDFFYSRVERTTLGRMIHFQDQAFNGGLALLASRTGTHATIDLSSASDRIDCFVVERLFRRSPSLLVALRATRARYLRQSIDRKQPALLKLRKYATMGNATTFPVQSILFATLALASELYTRGLRPTYKNVDLVLRDQILVFGDDIIAPSTSAGLLKGLLHFLGLKVNDAKTFTEGNFRESCGVDAFAGQDVTGISVMEDPDSARPGALVSTVDVQRNLVYKGFFHTAVWMRNRAEQAGFTKILTVEQGDGRFGWYANPVRGWPSLATRFNRDYQIRETRCLVLQSASQRALPSTHSGLLQYFTEAPKQVTSAVSTLGYLTRRPKVSLRLGWA